MIMISRIRKKFVLDSLLKHINTTPRNIVQSSESLPMVLFSE